MSNESKQSNRIYISIGSNHEAAANLRCGVEALRAHAAIEVLLLSPVYETPPVGNGGSAPYLNAVIGIETTLELIEAKQALTDIETQCGRDPSTPKRVALDCDILLFNDWAGYYTVNGKTRPVPHPDIYQQAHVAVPLADLMPQVRLTASNETLRERADSFDTSQMIQRGDVSL